MSGLKQKLSSIFKNITVFISSFDDFIVCQSSHRNKAEPAVSFQNDGPLFNFQLLKMSLFGFHL